MKIFLLPLLFIVLLAVSSVNANEKTAEEVIAEYMKTKERKKELKRQREEARAELEAEKRKTESIKEVGKKLDELLGVLSKDK